MSIIPIPRVHFSDQTWAGITPEKRLLKKAERKDRFQVNMNLIIKDEENMDKPITSELADSQQQTNNFTYVL